MQKTITFPLAQDYTVAARVPDETYFIHDPGMAVLPDGSYIVFSPCWKRSERTPEGRRIRSSDFLMVTKSFDKGRTWQEVCRLPFAEATPIVHDGVLYIFTQYQQHEAVYFTCSRDGGVSWADPVKVMDAPLWNCQQSMARRGNKLYWVMDNQFKRLAAVCCDLDKGIMNPAAWRHSDYMPTPRVPDELIRADRTYGATAWRDLGLLEANVVDIAGKLIALSRVVLCDYSTANLCAAMEIVDEGKKLNLVFSHFYPMPGGQCKFNIVKDTVSNLYWMASNLQTNSFDLLGYGPKLAQTDFLSGPGNERRFLTLWYSADAFNWVPVGMIAYSEVITQSFMYPSMVIEGDDLLLLSRTSLEASNQHDADLSTFHRIKDFRSLAFNLAPKFP